MNFSHLEHLTERITLAGDSVDIVHVYSNFPDYHWVDAKESGPEGIACVDDAGRAAVAYLRHYEVTGSQESLARAKSLLTFVMHMQADDGQFYNFIFDNHRINLEGKTSYKSFGWWAARGVWSFGLGYRIFKTVDAEFAAELQHRLQRTFPYVDSLMKRYGHTVSHGNFKSPQWLLYEEASDATSELALGLTEYFAVSRDQRVRTYVERLAEGMKLMQDGTAREFPYALHRSWQTMWHMWGNGQMQVLATAGKLLDDKSMIESAKREANFFYTRLLTQGLMKELDVSLPGKRLEFDQIAYGIRPMAVGLIRLYEATKDTTYLTMAGLAGSWFFGNNAAGAQMYDAATGRCYDGIRDSTTLNKNSGAESTIEAIHTLLEIERYPAASRYLTCRKTKAGSTPAAIYGVFRDESGRDITLFLDLRNSKLNVMEGDQSGRL